jgi:CheY-like chemotaxis protein
VDIVNDGEQAITAVQARAYDVVLMDIQMPLMDGLAATAGIRELRNGRTVPIIALTAHALAGDRERCLAAGMNGYLTKPFKAQELFTAVDGWAAPAAPSAHPPPVDLEAFRRTMREADAEDAVESILETFVTALPGYLDTLAAAVAAKDAGGMQRAAHAFQSAAGSIGAGDLAGALQAMEQAASAGAVETACTEFERTRDEAERVVSYLRGVRERSVTHA